MPFPSEHASRQNDPDKYVRIRRQNDKFGSGIHAIFGVLKDGKTELQAIRFDADKFTPEKAHEWLKEHDYKTTLEHATGKPTKKEEKAGNVSRTLRVSGNPASIDKAARTMKVVMTTADMDREGEIISPKGIDLTEFLDVGVVLWNHKANELPIAKPISVEVYEDRIEATIQFAEHDFAQKVFDLYADGFLKTWSIGYIPDKKKGKTIETSKLIELSAVPVSANPNCKTKGFEIVKDLQLAKKIFGAILFDGNRTEEIANSWLSKTIRENGLPVPDGWLLEVEPLAMVDGKITQGRILGWQAKAMTTGGSGGATVAQEWGCPRCEWKGDEEPEDKVCPECGAKVAKLQERRKEGEGKDEVVVPEMAALSKALSGLLETKEGRILSKTNRERLSGLMTKIGGLWDELEKLLKETEPAERPSRNESVRDIETATAAPAGISKASLAKMKAKALLTSARAVAVS